MKILHVSLGDPRYRHGGLNQYCLDLMNEQKKMGHNVLLLYPGKFKIKRETVVKAKGDGMFSIENPLPVAITYGIDDPNRYMTRINKRVYESFLQSVSPDVIHVHSIQGIHLEFFETAKSKSIPIIFTTHDYYPLCYKCTFMDYRNQLCSDNDSAKCSVCNCAGGLSIKKQIILQSEFYQKVKNNPLIRVLKKQKKTVEKNSVGDCTLYKELKKTKRDFEELKNYYSRIIRCFDLIHANSEQSAEIYKRFLPYIRVIVIPITNAKIKKINHERDLDCPINFGYLGGPVEYKGYYVFEEALNLLDESGHTNWNSWFYGGEFNQLEKGDKRKHYCGYFDADCAEEVWRNIDVLIVPSQWKETFGFVVLEGLSRGIPVVCSNLVGAKYLLESASCLELIFKYNSASELSETMEKLMSASVYKKIQGKIEGIKWRYDMKYHTDEICKTYKVLLNEIH